MKVVHPPNDDSVNEIREYKNELPKLRQEITNEFPPSKYSPARVGMNS